MLWKWCDVNRGEQALVITKRQQYCNSLNCHPIWREDKRSSSGWGRTKHVARRKRMFFSRLRIVYYSIRSDFRYLLLCTYVVFDVGWWMIPEWWVSHIIPIYNLLTEFEKSSSTVQIFFLRRFKNLSIGCNGSRRHLYVQMVPGPDHIFIF
jgi:hypothetical protein